MKITSFHVLYKKSKIFRKSQFRFVGFLSLRIAIETKIQLFYSFLAIHLIIIYSLPTIFFKIRLSIGLKRKRKSYFIIFKIFNYNTLWD